MDYPDIDAALRQAFERIEALESEVCDATQHMRERIEKLEKFREGFPDDEDPLLTNPDGIRCGTFDLSAADGEWAAKRAERERVERWHRVYEAAIGRIASFTHGPAATEQEIAVLHDTVHRAAVLYANRAHGPLEAKYPTGPGWSHYSEQVDALVRCARGAADFLRDGAADEVDIAHALDECLRHFTTPAANELKTSSGYCMNGKCLLGAEHDGPCEEDKP